MNRDLENNVEIRVAICHPFRGGRPPISKLEDILEDFCGGRGGQLEDTLGVLILL